MQYTSLALLIAMVFSCNRPVQGEMSPIFKAELNKIQANQLASGNTSTTPTFLQKAANATLLNSYNSNNNPTIIALPPAPQPSVDSSSSGGIFGSSNSFGSPGSFGGPGFSNPGTPSYPPPSTTSSLPPTPTTSDGPVVLPCDHAKDLLSRFVKLLALHVKDCGMDIQRMNFAYIGPLVKYFMGVVAQLFKVDGCSFDTQALMNTWNHYLGQGATPATSLTMISPIAIPCHIWQNILRQMAYLMGYISTVCPKKVDEATLKKQYALMENDIAQVLQKGQCAADSKDLERAYKTGSGVK